MNQNVKYVIDESGNKTSVLVPVKEWKKLNENYEKLKNKLDVFKAIKDGIIEVKTARKKGIKLQSLSGFLMK
ncbi:MAG: hypothetical protein FVQ77_08105 [Cytophagales bacterium]|nr:hypothetical protein [Cytophagales bacterium]